MAKREKKKRDIAAEVRETLYYERGIGHPPGNRQPSSAAAKARRRAKAQDELSEKSRKLRREERLRNKEIYERTHGPSKWDK